MPLPVVDAPPINLSLLEPHHSARTRYDVVEQMLQKLAGASMPELTDDVTPEQVPAILAAGTSSIAPGTRTLERNWYYPEFETAKPGEPQARIVLRNTGRINPEKIEEYIAEGGYSALATALTKMKPQEVIETVIASGLRGRGGGGFSTGRKWQFAADQKSEEKFIICNADEGDPGAFMDLSLIHI